MNVKSDAFSQHQCLFQRISFPNQVAKVLELRLSINPSSEYSRLISFMIDWLDLQGTLKSLLQHHSSKASLLQRSAFLMVQLSHPYMTTGKTIALTKLTFVGKLMTLFFNLLSRLVIAFLPRSRRLLISWLQSLSGDGTQKIVSHHFTSQNRTEQSPLGPERGLRRPSPLQHP